MRGRRASVIPPPCVRRSREAGSRVSTSGQGSAISACAGMTGDWHQASVFLAAGFFAAGFLAARLPPRLRPLRPWAWQPSSPALRAPRRRLRPARPSWRGLLRPAWLRRFGRRLVRAGSAFLAAAFFALGFVIMVMVVIMAAARAMDMAVLGLDRRFQLLAGHLAVGDLGLVEQEVDDLVLVERGAQLGGGHRLLLDIFDEALAILGPILLRRLRDQPVHLLLADLDAIGLADLRQQQAEAHAALGDRCDSRRARLSISAQRRGGIFLVARLMLELLPDLRRTRPRPSTAAPGNHGRRRAGRAACASCGCG